MDYITKTEWNYQELQQWIKDNYCINKNVIKLNISKYYLNYISNNINNLINLKTICLLSNETDYKIRTQWKYEEYQLWIEDNCPINNVVTELNMNSCELKYLSEAIDNLVNLQNLICPYNKLYKLPESIGNLINLKEICCIYNRLKDLPKSIGNLTNLKILNISKNNFKTLPKIIGKLTNLQILDCDCNYLIKLPKSIFNLVNLQILNCFENKLINIPEYIGNLTNLQELDCCCNYLNKLPNSIIKLKKLQHIIYDDNNENIFISNILQRYINKTKLNNVHNNSIQTSLSTSINNLLSENSDLNVEYVTHVILNIEYVTHVIIEDNILNKNSKNIIFNFIEDKTIGELLVTFEELLIFIYEKIEN